MPPLPVPFFFKGDQVEVMKQVNGPHTLTYYAATVLSSPSNHKPQILVQYNCDAGDRKGSIEMVDFECLRPVPRRMLHERFRMGDRVDVFCDDGWQKGTVKDLLENSMYVVGFDGKSEGIVAEQCRLRLHREWDDGLWTPPIVDNKTSFDMGMKPKKVRIKITCTRRNPVLEQIFKTGSKVEVRSDEEGYIGAWFDATIVGIIGNDKYMIEYVHLLNDDGATFFREVVSEKHIRPRQPLVSGANFERFDKVDAWYQDGWWEGVVSEVGNEFKFVVYFSSTDETMEFAGSLLRPHQEWINGQWKRKEKSVKLENVTSNPTEKFSKGMKVEVRSDEVGFQGAWFAAIILEALENDKYVIQYRDLLADDGSEFLIEEANGSDIRPIPPPVPRLYPFRLCEMVEALYNDGWWVGRINRIHVNSKYTVHFKTDEDMEFEHCLLRTHQEYIDGNWVTLPTE
ncbi:agenet domain-containing protein [Euphorbia peplus]|nr:agenet domain-containing protein [Euphorbia peplus]